METEFRTSCLPAPFLIHQSKWFLEVTLSTSSSRSFKIHKCEFSNKSGFLTFHKYREHWLDYCLLGSTQVMGATVRRQIKIFWGGQIICCMASSKGSNRNYGYEYIVKNNTLWGKSLILQGVKCLQLLLTAVRVEELITWQDRSLKTLRVRFSKTFSISQFPLRQLHKSVWIFKGIQHPAAPIIISLHSGA